MSPRAQEHGRVVALDPGAVRIGVAVCDAGRVLAVPRDALQAGAGAAARCVALVREEAAVVVVVGHPVRLDGREGSAATGAVALADELREALADDGVDVVLHDERLTTVTAAARLRDAGVSAKDARSRVDGAAAAVLLESWLAS